MDPRLGLSLDDFANFFSAVDKGEGELDRMADSVALQLSIEQEAEAMGAVVMAPMMASDE